MKFRIGQKELSEVVAVVSKAVAVKGIKAILSNFHITVSENKVRFVGTDQEVMMISSVNANVEQTGVFTIPAKLLEEIISSLPSDENSEVMFELEDEESGRMAIKSGRSRFELQIQSGEEFPPVPVIESEGSFVVNRESMLQALKETVIAINTEETNPVQRSIFFDFSNGDAPVMASTDSKRLAVTKVKDLVLPEELRKSFIVPARAIPEIMKLLENREEVHLALYGSQLLFSTSKDQFITRLVDGQFPDYARILPKSSSHNVKMARKDLVQAFKVVAPIARNINGQVQFDFGQNEVKVWSDARESGLAEHFIPCELDGEPMNIAFNVKFLQDFASSIADEEVVIEMTTSSYPGLFRPGNPDSDFKYVVMPMFVAR